MSQPSVAAIVLNYNGREITLEAISSLLEMAYEHLVVVHVDNGSTDGSYEAVEKRFPDVLQVRIEENQGVVHGVNRGLAEALDRGCDYLLLLNNDIEVDPQMLGELVAVAEGDSTIGCVGPKIFYAGERERLWSAGGRIRFLHSITRERGMGEIDQGQYERDEEVGYVNGCAVLMRSSVVREVGLWDPLFQLALDDADWCMRMKLRGFRSVYAHRAVLFHKVGYTVGGYQARRTFYNGRSAALFVRRYAGLGQWASFLLLSGCALPLAFLRELPRGNQGAVIAKLRGIIEGLRVPLGPAPGGYDG